MISGTSLSGNSSDDLSTHTKCTMIDEFPWIGTICRRRKHIRYTLRQLYVYVCVCAVVNDCKNFMLHEFLIVVCCLFLFFRGQSSRLNSCEMFDVEIASCYTLHMVYSCGILSWAHS